MAQRMKLAKSLAVLAMLSGVACGLGVVGSEPESSVPDAGAVPPPTSEPVGDAGGRAADADAEVDAADAGPHGIALELDGTSDFVRAKRPVKDDFTLEAWIQTTTGRDGPKFFEGLPILWADVAFDGDDFGMSVLGNKLSFGAKSDTVISGTNITTGAWVHVAVTRKKSSGAIALYVNGIADGTGTGPTTSLDACPTLDIGGNLLDGRYFKGRIREVRVWSTVRTANEIVATMSSSLVGNEQNLQAYWRLDDGSGIVAADSSNGKSNPGMLGAEDAGAGPDASTRPTWVTF